MVISLLTTAISFFSTDNDCFSLISRHQLFFISPGKQLSFISPRTRAVFDFSPDNFFFGSHQIIAVFIFLDKTADCISSNTTTVYHLFISPYGDLVFPQTGAALCFPPDHGVFKIFS